MENKKIEKRTVRPERIELARKLLQGLPEKDTRISKRETVALLESDIHKALKKGYSPREIAALLKTAGVIISAQLIKEVIEADNKKEAVKKEAVVVDTNDILKAETETETKNALEVKSEDTSILEVESKENVLAKVLPTALEEEALTRAKYTLQSLQKTKVEKAITGGRFEIIPDTPDDEL